MSDLAIASGWLAVLLAGFAAVILLRRLGLARTYARDVLHVGAGIWVAGWPLWSGWIVPVSFVVVAFSATALVPVLASRNPLLRRIHDSVAGEGERWAGLVAYAGAFAVLTALALAVGERGPAACAAGALCLGDGIGGLIGRKFGRHRFQVPWSKAKTWEGSIAVGIFSAAGIVLALAAIGAPLRAVPILTLSVLSAAVEALSPRAWDNALVPAAVFIAALMF